MYTYITGHLKEKQSCLGVKQPRNGVYEGRIRRKYRYLPYCLLQTTVISGASKYQAYRVVHLTMYKYTYIEHTRYLVFLFSRMKILVNNDAFRKKNWFGLVKEARFY